jgi:hypothetical protein
MAGAVTPAIARESYLHISTAVSAEMPENFFDRHSAFRPFLARHGDFWHHCGADYSKSSELCFCCPLATCQHTTAVYFAIRVNLSVSKIVNRYLYEGEELWNCAIWWPYIGYEDEIWVFEKKNKKVAHLQNDFESPTRPFVGPMEFPVVVKAPSGRLKWRHRVPHGIIPFSILSDPEKGSSRPNRFSTLRLTSSLIPIW